MLKELLFSALMSFNIVNAQSINKANTNNVSSLSLNVSTNGNVIVEKIAVSQLNQGIDEYSGLTYEELDNTLPSDYQYINFSYYDGQININANIEYITYIAINLEITGLTNTEISDIDTQVFIPNSNVMEYHTNYYQSLETNKQIDRNIVGNTIYACYTICFNKWDYEADQPNYTPVKFINSNGTLPIKVEYTSAPTEVIDIASLLFTIISLPFTFITNAFNLTLFIGTPYQINVSDIIMFILAGLTLIFIIKTITKLKG